MCWCVVMLMCLDVVVCVVMLLCCDIGNVVVLCCDVDVLVC